MTDFAWLLICSRLTNKGSSNKFIVDGQKGTKLDKATIVENMFDTVTKSTGMKTVEDLRKWAEEKLVLMRKKPNLFSRVMKLLLN